MYPMPRMAKRGLKSPYSILSARLARSRLVDVGVPGAWDPGFGDFMRNSYHYHLQNLDYNSEDPIGVSVCQLSSHQGITVRLLG